MDVVWLPTRGHVFYLPLHHSSRVTYTITHECAHADIAISLITSVRKRLCVHVCTRDRVTPQQVKLININKDLINIQRVGYEYLNYDGACGRVTRQPQTRNRQIDLLLCFLTSVRCSSAAFLLGYINSN